MRKILRDVDAICVGKISDKGLGGGMRECANNKGKRHVWGEVLADEVEVRFCGMFFVFCFFNLFFDCGW